MDTLESTMTLRLAGLKDREAVFALASTLASSFSLRREDFEKTLTQVLLDPDCLLAVAEWEGAVCGYVLGATRKAFHANGKFAMVEELLVSGPCQNKGIGSSLLAFFEAWARGKNYGLCTLASRRAGPFYEKLGYAGHSTYFRKVL